MAILGILAGALLSAGQYLLAKKMLGTKGIPIWGAFYIVQRLILSLGFLILVYFIALQALLYAAAGLVVTAIALPLVFNRKG